MKTGPVRKTDLPQDFEVSLSNVSECTRTVREMMETVRLHGAILVFGGERYKTWPQGSHLCRRMLAEEKHRKKMQDCWPERTFHLARPAPVG